MSILRYCLVASVVRLGRVKGGGGGAVAGCALARECRDRRQGRSQVLAFPTTNDCFLSSQSPSAPPVYSRRTHATKALICQGPIEFPSHSKRLTLLNWRQRSVGQGDERLVPVELFRHHPTFPQVFTTHMQRMHCVWSFRVV